MKTENYEVLKNIYCSKQLQKALQLNKKNSLIASKGEVIEIVYQGDKVELGNGFCYKHWSFGYKLNKNELRKINLENK